MQNIQKTVLIVQCCIILINELWQCPAEKKTSAVVIHTSTVKTSADRCKNFRGYDVNGKTVKLYTLKNSKRCQCSHYQLWRQDSKPVGT
jgi:hypothetical protein